MSAQHHKILFGAEEVRGGLIEGSTIGAEIDNLIVMALCLEMFDAAGDRFNHHHHPCTATESIIINSAVLVKCKFAQIGEMHFGDTLLSRAFHDTVRERTFQKSGMYGDDIYTHSVTKNIDKGADFPFLSA
jgi:hypothetical protein